MKILITHELFPPDISGGGEKLVLEMAQRLQQRGVEVKVLTTGNPEIKEYGGILTKRLGINRYLMNLALFSVIKEARDVDLIQTYNYNACFSSWLAGKILRKPVICFAFGLYGKRWLKMRGWLKGTISRMVEKIQLDRSYDKLIFLTPFSLEWAREVGISLKKAIIIPPGLDLSSFKPDKKEPYVLFCGKFVMQKGVYDLLKVAASLPNTKFVMMGWGEEEQKLKEMAPPNVEFSALTQKSGKPFFEKYSKAAVFFLPSYGETFGLVLVEAMASGCPVVSTIPLGFEGFVVKSGDTEEMAKRIKYLVDNPKVSEKMGLKNIQLAQKYNWDEFMDNLLGVYGEVGRKK